MKRILALLLLAVAPAFAQELPPIYDPVINQTYTPSQTPTTNLQNINQSGGTPLTLYDDGSTFIPINLEFDFYFFGSLFDSVYISQNGFISFTSNANGCCSGNDLPFLSENPYWNMNNSIFAMWSDLADFNDPGNPYYKSTADSFTVGWYGIDELGSPNKFNFEITLLSNSSFSIAYGNFDYNMPTGRQITSGYQGDTSNEFYTVYFGNDPTTLENKTFMFASNASAPEPPPPPPPPPEEPDPPIAPDCTVNPSDPTCIINALIPDTTQEEFLADTGFDNGSSDGTEVFADTKEEDVIEEAATEEILASEETAEEVIEEDIEEMLADEEASDEDEVVETVVVAKTLENEEKASVLSDSISKDVLEAALSIAADATAAGSVAGESTSSSSSSSSSSKASNETSETVVAETQSSNDAASNEVSVASNEGDASAELLETGRVMGQEALAVTLAGSEASANESMAEAESVSATSSETSMVVADSSITTTQSEETAVTEETQTQESNVASVAENVESTVEAVVAETLVQTEASTEMSFDIGKEMMAENAEQTASAEAREAEALNIVAAAAASSEQKFDDESAKDAEVTNAMVDPAFAMANTFNQAPNMMSLEFLGVLKPIEKSDAEVRAEQVVAANKEQQDAINANYMDADQSGIVAAIGAEADVSSYLSQRLQDAPFYKPEDIYKNIVIKDNVRGSYFLEKGNTDTYKKMVEEQYK